MSLPTNYLTARRFGVVAPSLNTVLEPELYGLGLPDVTFHFARVRSERGSDESILRRMADDAPAAAELLVDVRPEKVVYACTSGSLVGGPGFDQQVAAAISRRTGIPSTTTASAVLAAFQSLGVRQIGVATPYLEWVTEAEVKFFEAAGLRVVATASLGLTDGHAMAALREPDIVSLAESVDRPDAEAIFMSCTDLPTLSVVPLIERQLGKPVVSSNLATVWALVNDAQSLRGYSKLFGKEPFE